MNNPILENIKKRRSVRKYSSKIISDELIDLVTEAGTYAPTGMNRQSPTIVVIKDKETRDIISKLNASIMGVDKDPYYGAPVVILVLADPSAHTYIEDGSCVLENMMLAATSLDLDSVWVHREKEMFVTDEGQKLLAKWGLPTSLVGVGSIALGYKEGEVPPSHPRKENYVIKI